LHSPRPRCSLAPCCLQDLEEYVDKLDFGEHNPGDIQRQQLCDLAARVDLQLAHSRSELETLVARLNSVYRDKEEDPVRVLTTAEPCPVPTPTPPPARATVRLMSCT
jgi:hypothetical protein